MAAFQQSLNYLRLSELQVVVGIILVKKHLKMT